MPIITGSFSGNFQLGGISSNQYSPDFIGSNVTFSASISGSGSSIFVGTNTNIFSASIASSSDYIFVGTNTNIFSASISVI